MAKKIRKHKVYSKVRSRSYDIITIPEIRLEGKWLDRLGFKEGKQINIDQQKNKLTITLIKRRMNKTCEACIATDCLPLTKIRRR